MKFKLSLSVVFITAILFTRISKAQDAQFSQFYPAALYLNPALSATYTGFSISINHRVQWKNIGTPYSTSQVSIINPFFRPGKTRSPYGAIGLTINNDKTGDGILKTLGASVNGSYDLPLASLHHVLFGAQIGFIQKSVNYDQLQWGSQYSPEGIDPNAHLDVNLRNYTSTRPDLTGGIMYYFNPLRNYGRGGAYFSSFAGMSVYHFNRPKSGLYEASDERLPVLYKFNAGLETKLKDRVYILPNTIIQLQERFRQINLGLSLHYYLLDEKFYYKPASKPLVPNEIRFGMWYRIEDSFIFTVSFGNNYYSMGLSYDLNSSSLTRNYKGTGAYELSLIVTPFKPKQRIFNIPKI